MSKKTKVALLMGKGVEGDSDTKVMKRWAKVLCG